MNDLRSSVLDVHVEGQGEGARRNRQQINPPIKQSRPIGSGCLRRLFLASSIRS